ncbi:50S ribosomal protein L31 [Robiginitalea biformata HTCC2501]|uniref:50S ribosomal protein L31 n=1 Tax=Robiginitalea biformata (strain ATCC BAA-864 / DSM 15991 / KCTC 12146 / HTCC2501) TaxID=313596 RepID=A4CNK8_ROBBH|nr:50S ribosomal protein L31 [Robiginitalea biformata HTCC2501]
MADRIRRTRAFALRRGPVSTTGSILPTNRVNHTERFL